MENLITNDINVLKGFYQHINEVKSIEQKLEILSDVYKFVNEITPKYIVNNYPIDSYEGIKKWIHNCESLLPKKFIISSVPVCEFDRITSNFRYTGQNEFTLDSIVQIVRYRLAIYEGKINKEFKSLNDVSLMDRCEKSSCYINDICKEMSIKNEPIVIWPGFARVPKIYNGNGYHCINIITLGGKKYVIDCTYRQFFTLVCNDLERIKVMGLSGCPAGIFMTQTKERLELANQILKYGWFEATSENLKNYFDGFALSYRNGLYYETTNDYSYTTPYTSKEYLKFISHDNKDSQLKREGEEVLGFQKSFKPTTK